MLKRVQITDNINSKATVILADEEKAKAKIAQDTTTASSMFQTSLQ